MARIYRQLDRKVAQASAVVINFLRSAGMWPAEIIALKLSHLGRDADGSFMLGPVPLDDEIVPYLRTVVALHPDRERGRFLFCNADGSAWTLRQLRYSRQIAAGEFDEPDLRKRELGHG